MKPYEVIEHTADVGICAYGKDLAELFINAAVGMFSLITDAKCVRLDKKIKIEIVAEDKEELIHNWLSELLYQQIFNQMLLCKFNIESLDEKKIIATVEGEKLDKKRHILKKELKAVTYHGIKIEKKNDYLATQIIFDV